MYFNTPQYTKSKWSLQDVDSHPKPLFTFGILLFQGKRVRCFLKKVGSFLFVHFQLMTTEGAAVPGWVDVTDSQEGMPQARKKGRNYYILNKYIENIPTRLYIFKELVSTSPGTIGE